MRPSVSLWSLLAGSCCLFAAAVSEIVYGKVGDKVVLRPGSVFETITNIIWKDGSNLAMQWDGKELEVFRQFRGRSRLNTSTGEMTITNLASNDSGLYNLEINNHEVIPQIRLIVISPVPVPTVNTACDETSCNFTCDGTTTDAEPVTYTWKSDVKVMKELSKELHVIKEESSGIKFFFCELQNPVSQESSQNIANPFNTDTTSSGENPKFIKGIIVFNVLLALVVLLAVVHRWKAGMWFYEKASMPWEADFWRNEKRSRADTKDNAAEEEPMQEETLMT